MANLRRQGLTFDEIGARLGCSERTARRYVGKVPPQLHLPDANPQPEGDPRASRQELVSKLLQGLYDDARLRSLTFEWQKDGDHSSKAVYGGPPSILFLSEAERLIRERLDSIGLLALRFLARDVRSQRRFLRETVGFLYQDYVNWHQFSQNFDYEIGDDWRPPRERPAVEVSDEDDLD